MRDSTAALWRMLRAGKPVTSVLYEDFASREQLLELAYLVAPSEYEVHRTEELGEAFRADRAGTLLLFAPRDEVEAVRGLDARRDVLATRTAPVVVFLLRHGAGLRELASCHELAAMLQEQEVDPDELDTFELELERQRFCDEVSVTPEAWLAEQRAGHKADTPENTRILHQALLLERPPRG